MSDDPTNSNHGVEPAAAAAEAVVSSAELDTGPISPRSLGDIVSAAIEELAEHASAALAGAAISEKDKETILKAFTDKRAEVNRRLDEAGLKHAAVARPAEVFPMLDALAAEVVRLAMVAEYTDVLPAEINEAAEAALVLMAAEPMFADVPVPVADVAMPVADVAMPVADVAMPVADVPVVIGSWRGAEIG